MVLNMSEDDINDPESRELTFAANESLKLQAVTAPKVLLGHQVTCFPLNYLVVHLLLVHVVVVSVNMPAEAFVILLWPVCMSLTDHFLVLFVLCVDHHAVPRGPHGSHLDRCRPGKRVRHHRRAQRRVFSHR